LTSGHQMNNEISVEVELYGIEVTVKGIYDGNLEDVSYWIGGYCINDIISKSADDRLYDLAMGVIE
jgi:hypothetical protein